MRLRTVMCAMFAVVAVTACSKDNKAANKAVAADSVMDLSDATPRDSLDRPMGRVRRPAQLLRNDTVNGAIKILASQLVTPPAGFPIAFTTYKPEDTQQSTAKIGDVLNITLTPTFGGKSDPNAFIQIQFDTTTLSATDPAGSALAAATKGIKVTPTSTDASVEYKWAVAAKSFNYSMAGKKIEGQMIVARRGAKTFHILAQYPSALAAAMKPRMREVINQWRWEDDYSYLIPSGKRAPTVTPGS